MKVSTATMTTAVLLAALASSTVLAEPLFQPAGAVLGNIDQVSELSPHVVLGYLASCANVTDVMTPENADCLFDNFISLQFPGDEFGDHCSPPDIPMTEITTNLQLANTLCNDDFTDFITDASALVMQVFESESCWSSLCQEEDILLRVESQYIEQCSGVELPYPLESFDDMVVLSEEEQDNAILTCMLDYVMDTPAAQFGFDEPPLQCWPPAYDNMGGMCPDFLAKPAFDHCTMNTAFFGVLEEEDTMFMPTTMSMSMSMKMDDNDEDEYDNGDDLTLLERFCSILEGLTTEKGLECLGIICFKPSAMPSDSPSFSPSSAPPSTAPSSIPSEMPSSAPSSMPSAALSNVPSAAPSDMPSAVDSSMPSASPSVAPSAAPSSAPTVIVSNPEGVQSSLATTVSIGATSLVLLVATLFAVG